MVNAPSEMPTTEVDDMTLARVLRCDESAIRKYARAGIIKRVEGGKLPLFQSTGAVVEHLRELAAGHDSTGEAMKAGAALKQAQRRAAELKAAKLDGSLLDMGQIERVWMDLAQGAKWLFLSLPDRAVADHLIMRMSGKGSKVYVLSCSVSLRSLGRFSLRAKMPCPPRENARAPRRRARKVRNMPCH